MAESVGPAKQGVVGDIQLSWENSRMVILDRPQCQRNPCAPGPTHRKSWRVMNALKFQGDDGSRRGKFPAARNEKPPHEAIGSSGRPETPENGIEMLDHVAAPPVIMQYSPSRPHTPPQVPTST